MGTYKSFAVTVTGGSHMKHGKGREDAVSNHDDTSISIAVVADGHGDDNCFRSAKGAELAVACATRGIQEFIKNHGKYGLFKKSTSPSCDEFKKKLRENLIQYVIRSWIKLVADHYEKNPFTTEELAKTSEKYRKKFEANENCHRAYGTTLIAAAITPYYWFGFHIGDGRFTALYPDGTFDQPVPWDEKCNLNVTTSICDDDAFDRARCYFSFIGKENSSEKPIPVAVFLCSDGVDDNYPVEKNEEHLFKKVYRPIALTFDEDGFESTKEQLKGLANRYATEGKGDDTSIAGFIDMEALKLVVPIWKKQIVEEEADAAVAIKKVKSETAVAVEKAKKEAATAYEKNNRPIKDDPTEYGSFENSTNKEPSKQK